MSIPEPYDVRTSDPEREAVAEALREHAAVGRLDADELDERLGRAYGARLRSDLLPLLADLPQAVAPRPPEKSEPPRWAPVIPIAILLIAIWALTGAGYFWPMWPIGAMLLVSIKHGSHGCAQHRRPYSPAE
jgi:hypothetical protein